MFCKLLYQLKIYSPATFGRIFFDGIFWDSMSLLKIAHRNTKNIELLYHHFYRAITQSN